MIKKLVLLSVIILCACSSLTPDFGDQKGEPELKLMIEGSYLDKSTFEEKTDCCLAVIKVSYHGNLLRIGEEYFLEEIWVVDDDQVKKKFIASGDSKHVAELMPFYGTKYGVRLNPGVHTAKYYLYNWFKPYLESNEITFTVE